MFSENNKRRLQNLAWDYRWIIALAVLFVSVLSVVNAGRKRAAKAEAARQSAEDARAAATSKGALESKARDDKAKKLEAEETEQKRLVKEKEENRERLRRRFLRMPAVAPPAERPIALVAFRDEKPDSALAADISSRLASKKVRVNPAIFSAEFAEEYVRQRTQSVTGAADFQPADYASGLVVADTGFEDGEIASPARMKTCNLRLELRWQAFSRGTSELLWQTRAKGVGFTIADAHSLALQRAFESLDVESTGLSAKLNPATLETK